MLARIEPFWSWHTPIAWTGYIFAVDGFVWRRRGRSLLRNAPVEAIFMALVSIPLWVVFEEYNKHTLHNWHYAGLPDVLLLRYVGYAWAFATIFPAIFETTELVGAIRDRRSPSFRCDEGRHVPLGAAGAISIAAGAALLLLPVVHPSPWLAAPVWLGFIFLLDPINAAAGDESIRGDFAAGHRDRLVNLLVAGLICGVVWECWNFWSRTKWIYHVPVPPDIRIFEMPLAGYAGFPAFAVECFAMYVLARRWLWQGARRPVGL